LPFLFRTDEAAIDPIGPAATELQKIQRQINQFGTGLALPLIESVVEHIGGSMRAARTSPVTERDPT
jgi:hypothetical protein